MNVSDLGNTMNLSFILPPLYRFILPFFSSSWWNCAQTHTQAHRMYSFTSNSTLLVILHFLARYMHREEHPTPPLFDAPVNLRETR